MPNGHAYRRWMTVTALVLSLPMLAGCDNTPNPKFEKKMQELQSGNRGDSYGGLSGAPRIMYLPYWKEGQYEIRANYEAETFAKIYEPMLAQLDTEKVGVGMEELFVGCRTAFAQTLSYQKQGAVKPGATAVLDGATIFADLQRCRERALQAGKADDKQAELLSSTLRQFSSASMILIGVSMIARGEQQAGLKLWKAGDDFLDEDRSGFKLSLQAFYGY